MEDRVPSAPPAEQTGSVTCSVTGAVEVAAAVGQMLDAIAPVLADDPTGRRLVAEVLHAHADLLCPEVTGADAQRIVTALSTTAGVEALQSGEARRADGAER